MPSTQTICYYAMYVIGEVESNWNWTSVYYVDPITIGMMQWYGTRAAALLNRVEAEQPTAYPDLAQSLRDSLAQHPATDSYWTGRYLTQAEGNSIVQVFSAQENHIIQENQAISDFEGYITTLEGYGMSQSNPKPLIFAMAMWHQSPRQCGRVIQAAGGTATLERLYQVCMNDGILGIYKNRYNTVKSRLDAWDGESDPPDFGQVGSPSYGGNSPQIGQNANQISHVIQRGDSLILFGPDYYKNGVIFYKSTGQTWIPGVNKDGTPITGGNTGGGSSSGSEAQRQIVELYTSWVGKFAYSQGPGRLDPITSGYGDCSSTIWFAYQKVTNMDIGTWTGAQVGKGRQIATGSGPNLPLSSMQPADLVFFNWGDYNSSFDHVELYIGNNQFCGHGSGQGPTIKADANVYAGRAHDWMVRRYL